MNSIRSPIRRRLAASAGALVLLAGLAMWATTGSVAASPNYAVTSPAMVPADCQCGGPGGSADLAHISPWNYSDCNYYSEVGRAGVHAYKSSNMADVYIGWAQWVYSNHGSCRGYQWLVFHISRAAVSGTTAAGGYTVMEWLTQDPLDWTTFAVNWAGGQSDGEFESYAVMAGPLRTSSGVWTSLVRWTPGQNPGGVFTA